MRNSKLRNRLTAFLVVAGLAAGGCSGNAEEAAGLADGQEKETAEGGSTQELASDAYTAVEEEIGLPEPIRGGGEDIVGAVKEEEGLKLFALRQEEKALISYTMADGGWQPQEEAWAQAACAEADQGRLTVFQGEDGSYYAWYIAAGERPHIVERTGEDSCGELDIPSWQETIGETDYVVLPEQVAVLQNGNVVMTSRMGTAEIYDRENGNQRIGEIDFADWGLLTCAGSRIFGNMERLDRFSVYDTETGGELLTADNAGRSFSAFYTDGGKEIYGCAGDGVWRLDGETWTKVFGPEQNSLSDPSLLAVRLFEAGGSFYILYRNTQNDSLKQEQPYRLMRYTLREMTQEEQQKREETTFTVWGMERSKTVEYALQTMRQRHPDVTFQYTAAAEEEAGAVTRADQIRNLNAGLLSGNGPDFLILDGLDSGNYIEQGMLLELSEVIGSAGELNENILQAFRQEDGSIYEVPARFLVPMIFTARQELTGLSSVEELNRWMREEQGIPLFAELTAGDAAEVGYRFFAPELFEEDGTVDTEKLGDFLDDLKEFGELNGLVEQTQREFSYTTEEPWDTLLFGEAAAVVKNVSSLTDAQSVLDAALQCGGGYWVSMERFIPACRAAIPNGTQHRELAEELLSVLLSNDVQTADFMDGFPVRSEAMEQWKLYQSGSSIMIGDENGQEISAGCASPEQIAAFLETVGAVKQKFIINEPMFETVKETTAGYLDGTMGKEQVIETIKNQLSLYREE